MLYFALTISAIPILGLLFVWFWNFRIEHSPYRLEFLRGVVPRILPDGLYRQTVTKYQGRWVGKRFYRSDGSGVNVFMSGPGADEDIKYPFKMYAGWGVHDRKLEVVKIDYDLPENPPFARALLEEIVLTEKGLLGKIHYRVSGDKYFTLAYGKFASAEGQGVEVPQAPISGIEEGGEAPVMIQ